MTCLIVYYQMEVTNKKVPYESPEVEIVEVKNEGVTCASELNSPSNYPGSGNPFNF